MTEMNKSANRVINHVIQSGELATIHKHGEPIAEIRPVMPDAVRRRALDSLGDGLRIHVEKPIDEVIEAGRRRGF